MACLLVVFSVVHAQQLIRYDNSRVERDSSKSSQEKEVSIDFYSLESDTVDLRHYKEMHPHLRPFVEDQYPLHLPDLSAWRDTAVGVCYLTWGQPGEGDVILFLVGNRNTPYPAYYLDYNLDYDFRNDGGEFHFRDGEKRLQVKIQHEGWKKRKYSFYLIAPQEVENVRARAAKTIVSEYQAEEARQQEEAVVPLGGQPVRTKQVRLELGILGGGSRIGYRYINWRNNMPTTYNAYSTEKGLMAGVEFRSMGFRFHAIAGFEHAYYWSSQKLTQLGEPYWICDSDGNCIYFENRIEERNAEVLPKFRTTVSALGGYAFDLGQSLSLQPMIGLAWETYMGVPFVPKRNEPAQSYSLSHTLYLQAGGQFDFKINETSALFLRGTYLRGRFEPKGFYDNLDIRTKTTWHRGFRFELGGSFAVW